MTGPPEDIHPRRLSQHDGGALLIEWSDGHQTTLSPKAVRLGCPCAMCREEREHAGASGVEESENPNRFRVRKLERIGRYAISIVWGDGHGTGIYSWPILRGLCSCFGCRLERGEV
jgi:DUF971 family protein